MVLLLITVLVRAAAGQQNIAGDEPALGAVMFGVVVLVVLALALLVAPALAAQSVNGDREPKRNETPTPVAGSQAPAVCSIDSHLPPNALMSPARS